MQFAMCAGCPPVGAGRVQVGTDLFEPLAGRNACCFLPVARLVVNPLVSGSGDSPVVSRINCH